MTEAASSIDQTIATLNATVNPNIGEVEQMRIRIRHDELLRLDRPVLGTAGGGLEPGRGLGGGYGPGRQHDLPLQDLGDERGRHEHGL